MWLVFCYIQRYRHDADRVQCQRLSETLNYSSSPVSRVDFHIALVFLNDGTEDVSRSSSSVLGSQFKARANGMRFITLRVQRQCMLYESSVCLDTNSSSFLPLSDYTTTFKKFFVKRSTPMRLRLGNLLTRKQEKMDRVIRRNVEVICSVRPIMSPLPRPRISNRLHIKPIRVVFSPSPK